jgi:hypothetical protein
LKVAVIKRSGWRKMEDGAERERRKEGGEERASSRAPGMNLTACIIGKDWQGASFSPNRYI